jgi:hypothetical protein
VDRESEIPQPHIHQRANLAQWPPPAALPGHNRSRIRVVSWCLWQAVGVLARWGSTGWGLARREVEEEATFPSRRSAVERWEDLRI